MHIKLEKISKRYRFEWIFKNISYEFHSGNAYAVLGPNGSGKSTFLKILSAHLTPSKGKISFHQDQQKLDIDNVYEHLSYCAPYIELIEEFTLKEAILFHQKFKPYYDSLSIDDLLGLLNFSKSKNKEIRHFSSGMKQRLKLVLAICSNTPVLLLDEPTSNLDDQGFEWYQGLINDFGKDRLIIVASNVVSDYSFCQEKIQILDYK